MSVSSESSSQLSAGGSKSQSHLPVPGAIVHPLSGRASYAFPHLFLYSALPLTMGWLIGAGLQLSRMTDPSQEDSELVFAWSSLFTPGLGPYAVH